MLHLLFQPAVPSTAWPRDPSTSFSTHQRAPSYTSPVALYLQALAAVVPLARRPSRHSNILLVAEGPAET